MREPGRAVFTIHESRFTEAMYKTILVTLDGTPTDRAIIEHIKPLAKLAQSRVVLLHVADGWAARTFGPDAVSPEITEDTAYLNRVRSEFQSADIPAEAELAYGEPGAEIVKWVGKKGCDLVAMSTHGHRLSRICFLAQPPVVFSIGSACPFSFSGQSRSKAKWRRHLACEFRPASVPPSRSSLLHQPAGWLPAPQFTT